MTSAPADRSPLWTPLSDCRLERLSLVGGKAARLGELRRAGFPGREGFVLTTAAYSNFLDSGPAVTVRSLLEAAEEGDFAAAAAASSRIRESIETAAMPVAIGETIARGYEGLARAAGIPDPPVAVRSSATAECLARNSFAGQQESFLGVRGASAVISRTQEVWSSLFTPHAIAYRRSIGFPAEKALMAVIIQLMVDARAAGVMFTMNPGNGDRSKILIEANWGLGESVVSGEIEPDRYMLDKVTLQIISRSIARKAWNYVADPRGRGIERVAVDEDRQHRPCLDESEILSLARIARRVERRFGEPQDIEWAVDRRSARAEGVVLVQSRPETAWKARPPRLRCTPAPDAVSYVMRGLRRRGGSAPSRSGPVAGDPPCRS